MGVANPGQRLLLVVDDIAENRALLSRYFGSLGFQTAKADCGATALGLINGNASMPCCSISLCPK